MAARYSVSLPPGCFVTANHPSIYYFHSSLCFNDFHFTNHPFFLSFKVHVSFRFFRIANGISPWMDIIEIRYREIQCLLRPNSSHLFFTTTFTFSLQTVNYNSTIPILSETRESRETFDSEMLKHAKSF